MTDFVRLTLDWYRRNARDLPWRRTQNPYFIWLSEVILQQTRVDQGLNYYLRFTERFPSIDLLAAASEEEVLKLWQGLGYYSRARNLHATAKTICSEWNGAFPDTYDSILSLKGIGPYTAAAIASFSFDEQKAVVDGNVYRVLSRYFGIDTPIDSTQGKKEFATLADELIPAENPGEYNQAVMEFGAMLCTPASPDCCNCPHFVSCASGKTGLWKNRPVKEKKPKQKERFFHYFDCSDAETTIVVQRGISDVWAKLYEFPMIETPGIELPDQQLFKITEEQFRTVHILSHQRIHAIFYKARITGKIPGEWQSVSHERFHELPVHRLMHRYIELKM